MLSQAVGYAATALSHVAAAGGRPLLVKEIAQAANMPAPYLAKIIQSLARKGLVLTQRGIGGGVTLARNADTITLYELALALDDPCVLARCMMGTAQCSDERACPAHKFWTNQRTRATEFLQITTIADMAAFETRRRLKAATATSANAPRPPAPFPPFATQPATINGLPADMTASANSFGGLAGNASHP